MFVLSFLLIGVAIIFIIYQVFFNWVFKDPVSIKATLETNTSTNLISPKEVRFKIYNRISKAFAIEKIILKIGETYHILDNYKVVDYPSIVNGFETFTIKLPMDFLQQLAERDIKNWRKIITKVSITIRGNNASYQSDQIQLS